MSKIEEIQQAVEQLSPEDLARFRAWFTKLEARLWDEHIERDRKLDKRLPDETRTRHKGLRERDLWVAQARLKLAEIEDLRPGWDGYGSEGVSAPTLSFSAMLLAAVGGEASRLPFPAIVPMSNGAIMIEWRTKTHELTLEVNNPNDVDVLLEALVSGQTHEFHVTSDFSRIGDVLETIASSAYVAVA